MIRLSKHTADEMQGRKIGLADIEFVLAAPLRTTADPNDPSLVRAFRAIPAFGNRILRVVFRPGGDDVFIVTAHWDRGAGR